MTALDTPSTAIISSHAYMIVILFTECLYAMHFQDILTFELYLETLTHDMIMDSTNLL
ncbi:hypothetical protein J3R82DRAFT_11602 [Butyriboletus roseoflavus]|nr:hypothetical protein J3R82DRAFT_11602 [Butyriboletus roseoflavus]